MLGINAELPTSGKGAPMSADSEATIGLAIDQDRPFPELIGQFRLFESLGYASVWNSDHLMKPRDPKGPFFEGWTILAAIAPHTTSIRLGTLVTCNTFRNPGIVAKMAVTLDHVSNGRFELGLGAGWFVPEHIAYGIDFPEPRVLVAQFQEAVEMIDSLLLNSTTTYKGTYYQLNEAPTNPLPYQRPRMPLTLAGHGSKMLEIAACHADRWNSFGTVEQMRERNRILDEHCERIGRNPRDITRSMYRWVSPENGDHWASLEAFRDMVGRYKEVGVEEFIIECPRDDQRDLLEEVASVLIKH